MPDPTDPTTPPDPEAAFLKAYADEVLRADVEQLATAADPARELVGWLLNRADDASRMGNLLAHLRPGKRMSPDEFRRAEARGGLFPAARALAAAVRVLDGELRRLEFDARRRADPAAAESAAIAAARAPFN